MIHRLRQLTGAVPLAFCLLVLLLPAASVGAQQSPPDIEEYEVRLREALIAAQRGDRPGLEQVTDWLIATDQITTADGSTLPVDNRWLAREMQRAEPDFSRIEGYLAATLDGIPPAASTAPPDALQQLDTIVSRPPFSADPPELTWLNQLLNAIFEVIADFVEWLVTLFEPAEEVGAAVGGLPGWIVIAVSVLIFVALVLWLVWQWRSQTVREQALAALAAEADDLTGDEAHQRAASVAHDGDYRTAVRYLYLSALLWLEERGLIQFDRSLTNYEYVLLLHNRPDVRARLNPVVQTFDRVWYGHAKIDESAFDQYRAQVEALRNVSTAAPAEQQTGEHAAVSP